MILVDTSVWIDHFRSSNRLLVEFLEDEQVLIHPFVLGEIACGNLHNRIEIMDLMQSLPIASKVSDIEILHFIEKHKLMGHGIGLIDIHLLASCTVDSCFLWTLDKRPKAVSDQLHTSPLIPNS